MTPKIEAMEASWNRLRAISGAETPEHVIEYWQGMEGRPRAEACGTVHSANHILHRV